MRAPSLALVALTGCSSILGIEDLSGPNNPGDGGVTGDTPDGMVASFVELSGTVDLVDIPQGSGPVGGAVVEFVRMPERQTIGSTTTGAGGVYALGLDTGGAVLDGYLRLGDMGLFRETFCYPPLLTTSTTFEASVFSESFIDFISEQSGQVPDPGRAFTVIFVVQPGGGSKMAGRSGVRINSESDPNMNIIYADASGFPVLSLGATSDSGIVYIPNLTAVEQTLLAEDATTGVDVGQRRIDARASTVQFVPIQTN